MNRTGKFRIYDPKEKSLEIFCLESFLLSDYPSQYLEILQDDANITVEEVRKDLVFMRDTEKRDKNNKRIFEGDVVIDRTCYTDLCKTEGLYTTHPVLAPYEVYYCVGEAQFRMKNNKHEVHESLSNKTLEVIGNVYENPELIEEK